MTKAEMSAEIDRLKEKCNKQTNILRHVFADRFPDTFFICGESGDKDEDGLPDHIMVCPAYGCDWFVAYARVK
jgi:hypothetical protein